MSETPRTDAELVRVYGKTGQMCAATPICGHPTYVPAAFARQLERELAQAHLRAGRFAWKCGEWEGNWPIGQGDQDEVYFLECTIKYLESLKDPDEFHTRHIAFYKTKLAEISALKPK